MIRVLVTGAAGQLGSDLVAHCREAGDDVLAADRSVLDITNRAAVHDVIAEWRPDVVVNCGAWTAVDACEGDPARARSTNADAVRWLTEGCDAIDARLVQIGTDYVFDGTKIGAYLESDPTNPQSVYGATKLDGERAALEWQNSLVVRTSWVCGAHGHNMVRTVERLLAEDRPLAFVDDQVGCPSFTADLAPALRLLALEKYTGIAHLTNSGAVSWFEFVREIVSALGRDPGMVRAISTAELQPPRPARRPANSVLDNAKWREWGHEPLRDFRAALHDMLA